MSASEAFLVPRGDIRVSWLKLAGMLLVVGALFAAFAVGFVGGSVRAHYFGVSAGQAIWSATLAALPFAAPVVVIGAVLWWAGNDPRDGDEN